jgi:tetratricopeptide (TPR) repeat protein
LQAIADLTAAAAEHPGEEQFALLLGLAYLWRIAEPLPDEDGDLALVAEAATKARAELERAYALCPTDHRIPAWLGPILVNTGRALGDDSVVEEGLSVLQQGIDHYPSFVLFSKLLVYADQPATSSAFQMALAAVEENTGDCASGSVQDPACTNSAMAWHNVEGASVFMGDVLAKAGKKAEALAAYEGALASPGWSTWQWQPVLGARIADIHARVASFADDDPANDAVSAWQQQDQCSICHVE